MFPVSVVCLITWLTSLDFPRKLLGITRKNIYFSSGSAGTFIEFFLGECPLRQLHWEWSVSCDNRTYEGCNTSTHSFLQIKTEFSLKDFSMKVPAVYAKFCVANSRCKRKIISPQENRILRYGFPERILIYGQEFHVTACL